MQTTLAVNGSIQYDNLINIKVISGKENDYMSTIYLQNNKSSSMIHTKKFNKQMVAGIFPGVIWRDKGVVHSIAGTDLPKRYLSKKSLLIIYDTDSP